MIFGSPHWLRLADRPRIREWRLPFGGHAPLMPWITPAVPAALEKLLLEEGQRRKLEAGEYVYTPRMSLNLMTVVTSGVAGRAFGSMYNQSKQGMALAVAHRICGGNHTFYSGRPGNGRYFAVTDCEVITLPNARIRERMEEDADFRHEVEVQLECCIQSDRIGLAANAVLPVQDRVKLYLLTWAFCYCTLEKRDGEEWVRYPLILPQTQIARVTSASLIHVKRCFSDLRASGDVVADGDQHLLRATALDGVWSWLRSSEEPSSACPRPRDWRGFLVGPFGD
ncbi:Crp/Fnr family transcriptional regulator [Sutterella sp.]|uniref:Crp/Fnr family transcriptional regulator n=1 Tax=Sutterella sp. TaxID=1981025 RepID=UPI0026DF3121|nr:Crp/Fnr family transcriptional regulator [Sutterella sp.]MDO5531560.1 Crp/Fnr family transcriptional regulator [Sutterella sp.]